MKAVPLRVADRSGRALLSPRPETPRLMALRVACAPCGHGSRSPLRCDREPPGALALLVSPLRAASPGALEIAALRAAQLAFAISASTTF